jgi:ketosteroid isomerase-like protein
MTRNALTILAAVVGLAAAALPSAGWTQTPPPAPATAGDAGAADRAALEALNARWLNAYVSKDRAALESILADDFVTFRVGGGEGTRQALIDGATNPGGRTLRAVRWENLTIRVFGDVAVVAARSILTRTVDGEDREFANEYADIYARRNGEWKAIAAHVVRSPASAN